MPVTYSFTTESITVPTSDDFPCFDITEGGMPYFSLYSGVGVSRGAPWTDVDGDDFVMTSDDSIETIVTISLPIGQKFTLETQFKPTDLPHDLSALDKGRFFIAVFDAQDNAGGVLLSKTGLAIVSSYGNTVMPIFDSNGIVEEGDDYYTLRMVVDGTSNVMDLYITKTAELDETGHQLRYTTAAPITPSGTPDQVRIEVLGHPSKITKVAFTTMRVNCVDLLIPNKRPIADTGQDQTASLGSIVGLDGTRSYDPEGEELTYKWFLFAAPSGSSYRQDGTGGFSQDDGDSDGYTTIFEETGNPWSVENSPSLQPGDLLIVGGNQFEVAATNWTYNSSTQLYERDVGFDSNKLILVKDILPDDLSSSAWTLYHQTTFFDDRTDPQPGFVPDIYGMYGIQLIVNDGQLDSLPDQGLVNVAETNIAFGYIPDVNFIWDYLSDAWDMYYDRGPITTIWSSIAQIASNILLTAWQLDYAKSLVDIQRRFQRRWLNYGTFLEEPSLYKDDVDLKLVRGRIISGELSTSIVFTEPVELILVRDGMTTFTVSLSGTMHVSEIVDAINSALGESLATTKTASYDEFVVVDMPVTVFIYLEYSKLLVVDKSGSANSYLGFSTEEDTENRFLGWNGEIGSSVKALDLDGFPALIFDFTEEDIERQDLLIFEDKGFEIQKVAGATELTTLQDLSLSYNPSHDRSETWEISSFIRSKTTNFTNELVKFGDIVTIEARKTGELTWTELTCLVTGARGNTLGFNPRPLYELAGEDDISDYEVSLIGVRRTKSIPVDDLVISIPRLQEIILDPPSFLSENRDYRIYKEDDINGIHFENVFSFDSPPPDYLWAETTYLDNRPMIETNFGKAVDFTVENLDTRTDDLDYLSAVQGLWYAFFNGPSLWRVRVGIQILLGLPFAEVDGIVTDINETYNAATIRILIQDKSDSSVIRSYFIPRSVNMEEDGESMIEVNPSTGVEYVVGDEVEQFSPLSKGVEVADWIKSEDWWSRYHGQGVLRELDKFFHHLAIADVDVFNIANLVFAIDFLKTIKPHYTFPFWVIFKRLSPDTISTTDYLQMHGTKYLFDHPACAKQITDQGVGGAYRFDDVDGVGVVNWAYDGDPLGGSTKPMFLYDRKRLCPDEEIHVIMIGYFSGGIFPFDWIWAFDDGGGEDIIPLSGPVATYPPPYGPVVGAIKFDTSYGAGWYTRGKKL